MQDAKRRKQAAGGGGGGGGGGGMPMEAQYDVAVPAGKGGAGSVQTMGYNPYMYWPYYGRGNY